MFVLVLIFMFCGYEVVSSQERQKSTGRVDAGRAVYSGTDSTVQLQRFLLGSGTTVDTVFVGLNGPISKHAGELVVYGHEGGEIAPRFNSEIRARYPLEKKIWGYERVTVPVNFVHSGGQLFIGVERLEPKIQLVTDRLARDTLCWDDHIPWNDQIRIEKDGKRSVLPFGFEISLAVSSYEVDDGIFRRDSTVDDLATVLRNEKKGNLVCVDVTGDKVPEIVNAGVIQINSPSGWQSVEIVSEEYSTYSGCIDVDGDGVRDIVSIATRGDSSELFIHRLVPSSLDAKQLDWNFGVPKAHIVADADVDAVTDLIVATDRYFVQLLTRHSTVLIQPLVTVGIVDDIVAMSDLPISTDGGIVPFLARDVAGRLYHCSMAQDSCHCVIISEKGAGTSRKYRSVDIDAVVNLTRNTKLPVAVAAPIVFSRENENSIDARVISGASVQHSAAVYTTGPRYEGDLSSIVFADLDNDGGQELICSNQGTCRYLYVWKWDGSSWSDVTVAMGLHGVDDCEDVLVIDVDGDIKPELLLTRRGKLELYRNELKSIGSSRTIDIKTQHATGVLLTVMSNQGSSTVFAHSCHGNGYQTDGSFRYTQAHDCDIDSIIVLWPKPATFREVFLVENGEANIERGHGVHRSESVATSFEVLKANAHGALILRRDGSNPLKYSLLNVEGRALWDGVIEGTQNGLIELQFPDWVTNSNASGVLVLNVTDGLQAIQTSILLIH